MFVLLPGVHCMQLGFPSTFPNIIVEQKNNTEDVNMLEHFNVVIHFAN